MKNIFLKVTAFVLFILSYTGSRAQSTEYRNPQIIIDSSDSNNTATKLAEDVLDLKARKRNNAVLLEWSSEKETGITNFEIERSDDGKKFYKLEQKSSKNLSTKTPYSYLDQDPLPISYYRLKIISGEGIYAYSKVIVVSQSGSFSSAVQPNPFLQTFTVQTYLPSPQQIKIQLLDMNGKLIRYKSMLGATGKNEVEFDDVGSLQPGIYIVRIVRPDSIVEKRIVKGNQ